MNKQEAGRDKGKKISPEDYCWGRNPVISLLTRGSSRCMKVIVSRSAKGAPVDRIIGLCGEAGIPYTFVDAKVLDAMTGGENHQGVVASVSPAELLSLADAVRLAPEAPEPAMAVIMDHVEDPRNLRKKRQAFRRKTVGE